MDNADSFLSWEHAYTDGPFKNPLHYVRDNFTGNYTFKIDSTTVAWLQVQRRAQRFRFLGPDSAGPGASGALDRFGYMDPSDGGKVRNGTGSVYYKKNLSANDTLRVDGYVTRSLFDLFSDFTFYLKIRSRRWDSAARFAPAGRREFAICSRGQGVRASRAVHGRGQSWPTTGSTWTCFMTRIARSSRRCRDKPWTEDNVHITNPAVYAQQGVDFPHLHVDAGLRFDEFRFNLTDRLVAANSGLTYAGGAEPKVNIVYTPSRSCSDGDPF